MQPKHQPTCESINLANRTSTLKLVRQQGAGHSSLIQAEPNSLFRFASRGVDAEMMRTKDAFMQELSCLHGLAANPRHPEILATAFDTDETIAFDAVEQSQHSFSY